MANTPSVLAPETLEGWSVLHEIFHVDWSAWKKWTQEERGAAVLEATEFLEKISKPSVGESALFRILGHKGDLLLLHFRNKFDELNDLERGFRQLRLADVLTEASSYVSVVELGLYEMTVKLHAEFVALGLSPESEEWKTKWKTAMNEQRERMKGRLYTNVPTGRYLCFYPMDKKRGEEVNWYTLPIERRQELMRDHGLIGRKYSGQVTQIISGSIGFDDWEWGVDLFADDPLVFKKLIAEMRFDESSSHYALFGPFYNGIRLPLDQLKDFFSGKELG